MNNKLGIQVISKACGVLPHTLRMWEKRYNLFSPNRTENNQRLYSDEDLLKAKLIVFLLAQGHSISSLAAYSIVELRQMKADLKIHDKDGSVSREIKLLFKYLSNHNMELLESDLEYYRINLGVKDYIFNFILPILREMGQLVIQGKYTITQEHIISCIIRAQLSQIYLKNDGIKKSQFAFATPEGNLHEIPIIIADIITKVNRFQTKYLGVSHPAESLAKALNALKCTHLILGVQSLEPIVPYLKKMDLSLEMPISVFLGGAGAIDLPTFLKIKQVKLMSSFEEFDKYLGGID